LKDLLVIWTDDRFQQAFGENGEFNRLLEEHFGEDGEIMEKMFDPHK